MNEIDKESDVITQASELLYSREFWKKIVETADKQRAKELMWKIHDMLPENESAATVLSALRQATLVTIIECLLDKR